MIRGSALWAVVLVGTAAWLGVYGGREEPMSNAFFRPIDAAGAPGSGVALEVSFATSAHKDVTARIRVTNGSPVPIYVLGGLWNLDRTSKPIPDPQKIYRFVIDGRLRLLLGVAPLPRSKTTLYRNVPHLIPLEPKKSVELLIAPPAPLKEYNVYFEEQPDSRYEAVRIDAVELLVDYLVADATVQTRASVFVPGALELVTLESLRSVRTLRSPVSPIRLEILQRKDAFERLLPGEQPPKPS